MVIKMITENKYIQQLESILSKLDPFLVILFGSYAYGTPDQDSDLDVFVVLNDHSMPVTFKEKQELYLKVSALIRSVAKQIPIDLMVFTIPMFEQFKLANTNFSEEILTKGIVIYESKHQVVA
jgi:predicted nucleotidyltransferase